MKNILSIALIAAPLALVGCTEEVIVKKVPAPEETPAEGTTPGDPGATDPGTDPGTDPPATTPTGTADDCLDGQDMDGADVDISKCPALPVLPEEAPMKGSKEDVSLGAWELGTTKDGDTYKYGSLSKPTSDPTAPRTLKFMEEAGTTEVNAQNLECWAKGYYRLRKILQDPPAEYVTLKNAGFQYRFFQFQTDLRNGATGYKSIASFQDHLVKWVTVISKTGQCQQPTLSKFKAYAAAELETRGISAPQ
jgi:hypothetical protein